MYNLLNLKYITLDQFLDGVGSDFKKYKTSGLIDESTLYKTIQTCHEVLGIRINPIKSELVEIKNNRSEIPDSLKKIRSISIIKNVAIESDKSDVYSRWVEHTSDPCEKDNNIFINTGCVDFCGEPHYIIPYKQNETHYNVYKETCNLNNNQSGCLHLDSSEYRINFEESFIEYGTCSGEAMICYYLDLLELGIIPKQTQLFNWYEWCIKEKILESALMNSDDDVSGKLQYAAQQKMYAWIDCDNYIKSDSLKSRLKRKKQRDIGFNNKWVNQFY